MTSFQNRKIAVFNIASWCRAQYYYCPLCLEGIPSSWIWIIPKTLSSMINLIHMGVSMGVPQGRWDGFCGKYPKSESMDDKNRAPRIDNWKAPYLIYQPGSHSQFIASSTGFSLPVTTVLLMAVATMVVAGWPVPIHQNWSFSIKTCWWCTAGMNIHVTLCNT